MNISTLSQQLNMSTKELRDKMNELGYKVSPRQRKLDNQVAKEVLEKLGGPTTTKEPEAEEDDRITIPARILVKDLAARINVPVVELIKALINNGVMAAMHEEIDFDTASIVASEFDAEVELERSGKKTSIGSAYLDEIIEKEKTDPQESKNFQTRSPIVTIMGHVDHGKTTLLDTLRQTSVASGEAGAITQHIGAYQVKHSDGMITFLDTPGHEAFTQMRARGAHVTDIIVLTVAADDGVKPQTMEVINRARVSNVPMIIAINKMDKPDANPEKVKKQLAEAEVLIEEWGGKYIAVPISAKTGEGLDKLLEMIQLVAEVEDLKANPKGEIAGTVVESHVAKGKGSVATVIVQNGILRPSDIVVAGTTYGRVRSLEDASGQKMKKAEPSTPALIDGLSGTPQAGDVFRVVSSIDVARKIARENELQKQAKRFMHNGLTVSGKSLNLILKADVQGSLEALEQSIEELKSRTDEVQVMIIDKGVGDINESDVLRAESAQANILGFSVRVMPAAANLAKTKKVDIDVYDIIYELLEDITKAVVSMLSPEVIKNVVGQTKILAVFRTEPKSQIVGGRVEEGKIINKGNFSIKREGEVIGEGRVEELQRNKQDVEEVQSGSEFGLKIQTDVPVKEDDVLEIFTEEIKSKSLS